MTFNLFKPRATGDDKHLATLKEWASDLLPASVETTIMITELHCSEPGCPPVETVIALLSRANGIQQYKVPKPLQEVTRDDIVALA